MYTEMLQQLGLSKNEARIYETLLREGESPVGYLATKSQVHRRNVYDSLKGLIAYGLVFEIPGRNETSYSAIEPDSLLDIVKERKEMLESVMPELQGLYTSTSAKHQVYIYRGSEGWKNYMRDMLRVGEDAYFIAAKGGWLDERVKNFFPYFIKEARKKKMRFYHLFDHEVQEEVPEILSYVGKDYKFLPEGYTAPGAVDLFGDYVNLLSSVKYGNHPEEITFTVVVNRDLAEAFRTWFRYMWDICPDPAGSSIK